MSKAEEITRAVACDRLGISPKQLTRHVTDGMPCAGTGRSARFPWPEIRAWRDRWLVESGKRAATPVDLEDAERRLAVAQAEMAELKLAEMRRDLMTVGQYERVMGDALARVDAKLKHLPQRIAGVAWSGDLVEKVRQATPLVDDVRAELWSGDDIPTAEDVIDAAGEVAA